MGQGGDWPKPHGWKQPPPWNAGKAGKTVEHRHGCKRCPRIYTYRPDACRQCGCKEFKELEK